MSALLIGHALKHEDHFEHIPDLFEGLARIESKLPSIIVFNMDFKHVDHLIIDRIRTLLVKVNIPTLIISDKDSLHYFQDILVVETLDNLLIEECFRASFREIKKKNNLEKKYISLSKQKRTMPFYALGVFLFCEPLIKILFLATKTGFPLDSVLDIVLSMENPFKVIEFWALFPLAGLALIRPSAWSLFTFAGLHIYSIFAYFTYEKFTWPYVQETPHISSTLLVAFNFAILIYFMIPENRKPFVAKTQEMFRKFKRVHTNLAADLIFAENKVSVLIKDISMSGVRFECSKEVVNESCMLHFLDMNIDIKLKRSYQLPSGSYSYGASFQKLSRAQKQSLYNHLVEFQIYEHTRKKAA